VKAAAARGYGGFGFWAWTSLAVIFATSMYTDVSRFINPAGEKYMPGYFAGGQIDFSLPYMGARAFLAGENPYTTTKPEYSNRAVFKSPPIDGKVPAQLYPPGHLLMYVPLTLVYGADTVAAGRCWVVISMLCLIGIGLMTWRFVELAGGVTLSPLFVFFAVAALGLQPGVQLGLERGQSDILTCALIWGALLLFIRQSFGLAAFLTIWALNIKAYPLVFAVGIGLLMLKRRAFRRAALGALIATALFTLPAVRFLGEAFRGTLLRSNMFWRDWINHGFKNLVYHLISPRVADEGRLVLTILAALVAILWGFRAWRLQSDARTPASVFSLVAFATSALLVMLGYSALSISYNLILLLPGVVVLAASQDFIAQELRLDRVGRHVLGVAMTCTAYTLFLGRWNQFPLSGLGLVMELGILAVLGARWPNPPSPS
jgi:hypothetical protein